MNSFWRLVVLAVDWTPIIVALVGLVLPVSTFLGGWAVLTWKLWNRARDAEAMVKLYRETVGPIRTEGRLIRPYVSPSSSPSPEPEAWPYLPEPRRTVNRRRRLRR